MLKKHLKYLMLGFLAFFFKVAAVNAQDTVMFDVKSGKSLDLVFNTIEKYQNGLVQYNMLELNIVADKNWDLYVGANTADAVTFKWDVDQYYSANGDDPDIDILQLRFRNANSTSQLVGFQPITHVTVPQYVIGSNVNDGVMACPNVGANEVGTYVTDPNCFKFKVDLLVKPNFDYRPGRYSMEIEYVIVEDL